MDQSFKGLAESYFFEDFRGKRCCIYWKGQKVQSVHLCRTQLDEYKNKKKIPN